MEKYFCHQCGEEIIISWKIPSASFRIDENGLIRDDEQGIPFLYFHCCNDVEHDIAPKSPVDYVKFTMWQEKIEKYFSENILPNL